MLNRKLVGAAAMTAVLGIGGATGMAIGNPLSSGAQDGGTTTTAPATTDQEVAPDGRRGGHRGFGGDHLETAAEVLGVTTEELRASLEDGKTLAEVAAEKGVDKQKLIDALVAAASKRLDEAKASLPERMAGLVDGTLPEGGPGPGGGHGPGRPGGPGGHRGHLSLEAAATALGMSEEDVRAGLEDGKSLADLAAEKGVDKQKVIDALVADAKAKLADAVESGRLTQEQADERTEDLAGRIADAVEKTRPERPGPDAADDGEADGGN